MSSNQFSSSLTIIFFIFFLFLVDPRISFADDQEINMERFTTCSTFKFNCGDQQGIGYPFSGNNRPEYCGHPGYTLTCISGFTQIEIMSTKYRVLSMVRQNRTMRIAESVFLDDACPADFSNATRNFSLFSFTGVLDLDLFYGCPSEMAQFPNFPYTFKCRRNTSSTKDDAYFVPPTFEMRPQVLQILSSSCDVSVRTPIMEPDSRILIGNASTLGLVLREGFQLNYSSASAANFTFCDRCLGSGGQCGFNSTLYQHTCFCRNTTTNDQICRATAATPAASNKLRVSKLLIGIIVGLICASIIVIIIYCWIRKISSLHSHSITFWRKGTNKNDHQNMEAFFKNCGSLALKRYTYSDIKKMTNSFQQKLGEGGFGSVFKGQLHDGMLVAVKVLLSKSERDGEDFINEVASISRTSHVNIVTLLGFCFEKKKRAVIYEFMPNGSLEKFIYNETRSQLGWETLYQISIGIARGLEYLHRGCNTQILHFDIKPHNVLLDQDFCPKISDFGLAKLCPRKESMVSIKGARGTLGYIAPEVCSRNFGRVSYKSDVYSYGMMLLEMVGGRRNIDVNVGMDHSSQLYFPYWIHEHLEKNEDLGLHGVLTKEREELARKMIIVGLWCIQTNPSSRPSMSKVLEMLEGTIEALHIPPKPVLTVSDLQIEQEPIVSALQIEHEPIVSALQTEHEPIVSSLLVSTLVSSSTTLSIS